MTSTAVSRLFHDLEQGAPAITATRRLARQVEHRYADWKLQAGASAWPTPAIRVYDDWIAEIWQGNFEHTPGTPRLLTEDQELLLWEQIIRRRVPGGGAVLLQLSGTARAARRTWNRVHEWCLDWDGMREYHSADTDAFLGWAADMRAALADRNWLTRAQLPGYLAGHAPDWLHERREPVWWMGFHSMPPAAHKVMAVLETYGGPQRRFDDAAIADAAISVTSCGGAEEEWRHIARWARAELAANPGLSLGVVCPDLHRRRDEVEEILEDVLHPGPASRVDAPRLFHLSLGRPLSEYPIVASALDLLRWSGHRIPFDVVSRCLRSPYLGRDDDLEARVELETVLRSRRRESLSLAHLQTLAAARPGLESFNRCLATARALEPPGRAEPGAWAAFFSDWLRAFNWPGGRSLNSHEYQALSAWREQMSRFAGLAVVQNRWSGPAALRRLAATTSARILQFHDDQAPLQIMGASEAAGLWFDSLWLADMSDALWPPPPQPDPFIPIPLQKASGMPEASAQTTLAHTRARTAGLLASAPRIGISYAAESVDIAATLSPLFAGCQAADRGHENVYGGRIAQLADSAPRLEAIEDHQAPPLPGGPLRGGVNLLADQARCPFRALAHHRLRARDLEPVSAGLDNLERGMLVHDALNRLWERLADRDELLALDEPAVAALVSMCAAGALERQFADSPFQQRLLEIEQARLEQLLVEWLAVEKQRQWFRVAGTETAMQVTLGGVELQVRVDRIDELADGRRVIIDYKTGRLAAIRDWADPRMEEPQLPLYALGVSEDIAALVLAGVRRGECELRGIADDTGDIPSLQPVADLGCDDMAALRSWWAGALGTLVDEYRGGVARVDPKSPQTCRNCDAMPLCRIFERGEAAG